MVTKIRRIGSIDWKFGLFWLCLLRNAKGYCGTQRVKHKITLVNTINPAAYIRQSRSRENNKFDENRILNWKLSTSPVWLYEPQLTSCVSEWYRPRMLLIFAFCCIWTACQVSIKNRKQIKVNEFIFTSQSSSTMLHGLIKSLKNEVGLSPQNDFFSKKNIISHFLDVPAKFFDEIFLKIYLLIEIYRFPRFFSTVRSKMILEIPSEHGDIAPESTIFGNHNRK